MSIRVAAFMSTVEASGPARQFAAVAGELRRLGVEVTALCVMSPGAETTPFSELLRFHGVPYVVVHTDGRLNLTLVRKIERALASIGPNIVQSHSYRPAFIFWMLRRKNPTWKWVGFFHGQTHEDWKVRVYNALDRWFLQRTDHTVVVARAQLRRFPRARAVSHIANAVLPVVATDSVTTPVLDRDPSRRRIGIIGRLSHEKGVDVLLRAVALKAHDLTDCDVIIAGDGPAADTLKQLAGELGVTRQVQFIGPVSRVDLLYPALDLVVLASRTEGMPNVLLEAAHYDVPMVATNVGDVAEILTDPHAGTVVPPEDPTALAAAMVAALAIGRTADGTAARAAIRERFSLETRARSHAQLYRQLTGVAA